MSAGVAPATLTRALRGEPISAATIERLRRVSPRVRTAEEFSGSIAVRAPRRALSGISHATQESGLAWIRVARDAQLQGDFAQPVRLAEACRTDDALFVAYHNRVATLAAIGAELVPHDSQRGRALAAKARAGIIAHRDVLSGIVGTLANHGVAIGYLRHEPDERGTSVALRLTEWPLEFVKWDPAREVLQTRIQDGPQVDVVHGDGRWVVFRGFGSLPWTQHAALLPASFVYAAHAEGIADWAGASRAHGLAKILGQLPEGSAIRSAEGGLTAEAEAYLAMLTDLVSGEASAGIQAAGCDAKFVANGSTAWQVFSELVQNREKAAARIYLGTDAYLGSVGGAPGVDIATLFGVATTKIQGDFSAIKAGLDTGLAQPWAAMHAGDSRYAPSFEFALPDADAEQRQGQAAASYERLRVVLAGLREQGLVVDQVVVDRVAAAVGVSPAPRLA
ncbi:MAG: hypothetical protein A2Y78_00255 [Acidobacteria bacterium RBG_13_68_16]|nr:MAG: hypothetical protein A2Y78_00255 [Acidobacteria bacterium RBG_13_68_16]